MAKSTSGKKWALDISKWVKATNGNLELVARRTVLDMFGRVVDKSPVDEGRFINDWQASVGSAATGQINQPDKSGQRAREEIRRVADNLKIGETAYLTNNLPYAERLENEGWSQQAPQGMVATTAQEFGGIVDDVAAEVFKGK